MDKLRGSGSTFSTSDKRWQPFRGNPIVGKQNAKRWRLVKQGLTGFETKDEMRKLAARLAPTSPPTR